MELTTLQIDLLKSLAGLVLAGGMLATFGYGIKLIVDRIPTNLLEKVL